MSDDIMKDERLAELQSLDDATPEGPWGYTYDGSSGWSVGRADDPQLYTVCRVYNRNDDEARNVVEFITEARQAVPELIAEVRRLRGVVSKLKAEFGTITKKGWQS